MNVLTFLLGTPLERLQKNYEKHSRKYHECTSKAEEARTNHNYDYAEAKEREADSHLNMMNVYDAKIKDLLESEYQE